MGSAGNRGTTGRRRRKVPSSPLRWQDIKSNVPEPVKGAWNWVCERKWYILAGITIIIPLWNFVSYFWNARSSVKVIHQRRTWFGDATLETTCHHETYGSSINRSHALKNMANPLNLWKYYNHADNPTIPGISGGGEWTVYDKHNENKYWKCRNVLKYDESSWLSSIPGMGIVRKWFGSWGVLNLIDPTTRAPVASESWRPGILNAVRLGHGAKESAD